MSKKTAAAEKVTEKVAEKVTEKVAEKVAENVTEKVAEKVTEKVTEKVAEKKARPPKIYKIAVGKLPEQNQKQLGTHAVVITEAITALVAEGKEIASRNQIMTKAVELGLYTRKPTVQGTIPIFAWWRKNLTDLGWIKG